MNAAFVEYHIDWLLVEVKRWGDGIPVDELYPEPEGRDPQEVIADQLGNRAPRTAADRHKAADYFLPDTADFPKSLRKEVLEIVLAAKALQPERNRYVHDVLIEQLDGAYVRAGGSLARAVEVKIDEVERLAESYRSLKERLEAAALELRSVPTRSHPAS
jgi:hypothetical protein